MATLGNADNFQEERLLVLLSSKAWVALKHLVACISNFIILKVMVELSCWECQLYLSLLTKFSDLSLLTKLEL